MKIVLDSNVIVAAFATKGLCAKVFELCILNYEIILSEYIIKEVEKNLLKKIKIPPKKAKEIIVFLRNISSIVSPAKINESVCNDKSDLPIIGTAIAGDSKIIITGDSDLLKTTEYKSVKFLKPRDFWELSAQNLNHDKLGF